MRYMALKLPKYFYLLMEKSLGCHFQVKSPYYKLAQCNQKTWTPVSSRWKVRSKKVIKGWASTRITATTSAHLPKPASTDLTIKSDSALTNPTEKWGVKFRFMSHYEIVKIIRFDNRTNFLRANNKRKTCSK